MSLVVAFLLIVLAYSLIIYASWKFFPQQVKSFVGWFGFTLYYYLLAKREWKYFQIQLKKDLKRLEENLKTVPGDVVDVGAGFGIILEFLPAGTSVIAVEPSALMREYFVKELPKYPDIKLKKMVDAFGEDMSAIESGSVAAVTCTLLLCTVSNTTDVLKEIKRILKPGGIFVFLEHVYDTEPGLRQRLQHLLGSTWSFLFEGCEFRETWLALEQAGFKELEYSFMTCSSGFYLEDTIIAGYARV